MAAYEDDLVTLRLPPDKQYPLGSVVKMRVPMGMSQQEVLTQAENYYGIGVTRAEADTKRPETIGQSMAGAGKEMGLIGSTLGGLGTRVIEADMRMRQLLGGGKALTPDEQSQVRAGRAATGPASVGRFAADVGMALPTMVGGFLGNVAGGAGQAFLTEPVLPGESGAKNAGFGAVGAAAGYGIPRVLGFGARPITPSADVTALLNRGIVPTIGQSAASTDTNVGRMFGRAEEAGMSTFGAGDVIGGARRRANTELNQAALAEATPHLPGVVPTQNVGRQGVDDTYDAISNVYDTALTRIGIVRPNQNFFNDITRRVGQATVGLSQDQIHTVQDAIRRTIAGRNSPVAGGYTADIAKQVDSELGTLARNYADGETTRMMAGPVRAAQQVWRDLIRSNAPDQMTRDALDEANRAFANYIRVERASNKGVGGEFSAAQLAQAVRETSGGGARHAQHARGDALMQDLSDPARAVLTGKLGESGTVPRGLIAALLLGGGGAYGNESLGGPSPLTYGAGALALSPLLYSRAASRYAVGDLLPLNVQGTLAQLANASAPYVSAAGRSREVRPGPK